MLRTKPLIKPGVAKCYAFLIGGSMKGLTHQQTRELKQQIIEYRKQNHTMKEVMKRFGVTRNYVHCCCRGVQWNWALDVDASVKASQKEHEKTLPQREAKAAETIRNNYSDWRYVCGYQQMDGWVTVEHIECGKASSQSFVSIRKGWVLRCPHCLVLKGQQDQTRQMIGKEVRAIQRRNRQRLQQKRDALKQLERKQKRCVVCGAWTDGNAYCSKKCARHMFNARHEARRRAKIQAVLVDNDITLQKLYKRDKGICYLCGDMCDWNDSMTVNGAFIAGDKYPSIDHVRPLALGGCHAWNNVKLAHRHCNTVKRDIPPSKIAI